MQQHESRVDEVERTFRELVCDEINLGDGATAARYVRQVTDVSIHREHATTRQCGTAQPTRERPAAGAGL
jgi:hypothetical protein